MYFSACLIPTYPLIKALGLRNNFLVYIFPAWFMVWGFTDSTNVNVVTPSRFHRGGNSYRGFTVYPADIPVPARRCIQNALEKNPVYF
jgi:hypothetical protein